MPEPDELEQTFQRYRGGTPEEKQRALAGLEGYKRRDLAWLQLIMRVDNVNEGTAKKTAQRMMRMSKHARAKIEEDYRNRDPSPEKGERGRPGRMDVTYLVPPVEKPPTALPEMSELERLRAENLRLRKENQALQQVITGQNERLRLIEKRLMEK